MWRINKIQIKNICTLKDVEYSFNQGVTTLVFGHNLDNEGQKNNGSGKSALTEAIVFGLTGSPLRQVKNDELINNDEKSAYIKICLDNTSDNTELEIDRTIYKKGSPEIVVTMYRNGEIVDDGSTFKSGVDEYNKYILELLGLTKEDIYNSYVLSKHKYQDFLSASDKDKKEIINRFSNGNLVDQSITAVQNDKRPLEDELNKCKLELSNNDGRIYAIEEQIETEKENSETRRVSKIQRIRDTKDKIKTCHDSIIKLQSQINGDQDTKDLLNKINEALNDIDENSKGKTSDQVIKEINSIIVNSSIINFDGDSFNQEKENLSQQIKQKSEELDSLNNEIRDTEEGLKACFIQYREAKENFETEVASFDSLVRDSKEKEKILNDKKIDISCNLKKHRGDIRENNSIIANLEAKISGSIQCPHCGKHFILGDISFDIEKAKRDIEVYEKTNESIREKIDSCNNELISIDNNIEELESIVKQRKDKLSQAKAIFSLASNEADAKDNKVQSLKRQLEKIKMDVYDLNDRQSKLVDNMFDDLFDKITYNFKKLSNSIKLASETISSFEGAIKADEELINKLENETEESIIVSLQTSLKEYKKKRALIYKKHNELEDRIKALNTQEARFIAFKTYLANSKVEALNEITNDFLEQIGSDLRVRFDGYTMLKSGKIRDKISVSLLRDGIDAGSFSKFSEGEKARIQLATILAMNTLTNNNADLNKGLDLLVLDEILAAVDEEGLAFILESLNKLKITSLVVSHGKTAESYPYKLVITKQNGISAIG